MVKNQLRPGWRGAVLWILLIAPVAARPAMAPETACDRLAALVLPASTVTLAVEVGAGGFTPPGQTDVQNAALYKSLPAFCRVAATLTPSPDSDIRIEVWLPASGWNGKFQAVGNGGWAGSISYAAMAGALARGFATASTDTGHRGGRADFAIGHPERLVDFAYRAVHEMTVRAKTVIEARYGAPPKFSYWYGCSTGGRQGLKEAQRFPQDFDGIIAGAPANNWVNQKVAHIVVQQAFHKDPEADIPASKYPAIHKAVMQTCDALDGVADEVLEDPRACRFDPGVLTCTEGDSASCLTPRQVASARLLYSPIVHPRTGQQIFPGMVPGNELDWAVAAGPEPRQTQIDLLTYVTYRDPAWDYLTFDLESGLALALQRDAEGGTTAAVDPDLRPFTGRGGKLLLGHGWGDTNIMALNTIDYYTQVVQALGGAEKAGDSVRLFMVPGMAHCSGGAGTDTFDMVTALERWVEQGIAPERIPASRVRNGVVERTRPLCRFPQVARYAGTGSTDDAANFVCAAPADAR